MQAKIYLSKGTFSKNLANLVQLDSCLWHLVVLLEAVCDDFGEQGNFARSWTHCVGGVLTYLLLHLLDHQRILHVYCDWHYLALWCRIGSNTIPLKTLVALGAGACVSHLVYLSLMPRHCRRTDHLLI